MAERLLILTKGSKKDPEFSDQKVDEVPFLDYFQGNEISILKKCVRPDGKIEKDLIISCHGNTPLCLDLVEDIEKELAEKGHKVVSIQQGGLYFAKPSLEAANMPTVPVISVPLDGGMYRGLDAFLAPQVPTGTAVIGGVGVAKYDTAAKVAKEILTNEFEGVYLFKETEKLQKKLEDLGVPILGIADMSLKEGLVLGCLDGTYNYDSKLSTLDKIGTMCVFTPHKSNNPHDAAYLMNDCSALKQSVYVRGDENVAFFAAKIMSAYNPELRKKLYAEQKKKADSYAKRSITSDSFKKLD